MPNTKTQMQINWLHVKMLDQALKSQQSGFKCNGSIPYDTCMYEAVTNVREPKCDDYYFIPFSGHDLQHSVLLHRPLGAG